MAEARRAGLIVGLNGHRNVTELIHLARLDGMPVTDIAAHAGLSRSAVHRILKETRMTTATEQIASVRWEASHVEPGTPYPDEASEMVPVGWYVLGYLPDNDDRDGADIVVRVEHAADPVSGADFGEDIARAITNALVRGSACDK